MSTVILPAAYRLTYADWLRLPDDGRVYEIIDGELFLNPPPSIRHQRVSRRLGARLDAFLEAGKLGELFYAPTGVRLSDGDIVQPDLLVVLAEHGSRIAEQVIDGPPDLVGGDPLARHRATRPGRQARTLRPLRCARALDRR